MVDLTNIDASTGAIWDVLIEIARARTDGWTLVGAQMVMLRGFESGRVLPRASIDADVLVDVRVVQDGTARFARMLLDNGFELQGVDAFGIGHRFSDGKVTIDVLGPDGLGARHAPLTTVPPARTVAVPGGTQALRRSTLVDVQRGRRSGSIPCPSLLGAILVKARAVEVDDLPQAQLTDLAFLLALADDPRSLAAELSASERRWLRRRKELLDGGSPAWATLPAEHAANGILALRILTGG